MTRVRDIAKILGVTEAANPTNAVLTSTADGSGGVTVYATKEDLPSSGLTSGDQAYVTANSRFYISNGSGWYNVALINATPSLTIDPTGAIELSTEGATTTITLTATDSDNAVAGLTYSVESDGSFGGLATISQDSSVFTITPLSEDSATTETSTLTFKASDGISFGSGTRTFTLTFITTIENSKYTSFLAKADASSTDNQVDASTNSYTITENGNVRSTALSPHHPGGYSTYFDGSGDYLVPAITTAVGTSDFTLEGWFYPTSTAADTTIFDFRSSGNWGIFSILANNTVAYYNGSSSVGTTSNTVTDNIWNHIAIVRNSGSIKIYINGVLGSTTADTTNWTLAASPRIGGNKGNTAWMNGYIADVRFVSGTAVYTSNFTPPAERLTAIANTSLLTCHLPYIADGSTNNHTITVNGNISTKRFGPYDYLGYAKADHGGSVYFDGTGDYLSISGPATGVGTWTLEGWFYFNTLVSNRALFSQGTVDNTGGFIVWSDSNGIITFYSNGEIAQTSGGVNVNEWAHIAIVSNSNSITIFVNGVSAGTGSYSGKTFNNSPFQINRGYGGVTEGNNCYIADVRLVNNTAVYTAAFTPPTAPLTAITNTSLLTCTNKNDIWDASYGGLIVENGTVTASNTQRKFSTSSAIYHSGGAQNLEYYPETSAVNIGTRDFTVEFWLRADTTSGTQAIATMAAGAGFTAGSDQQSFWIGILNSGSYWLVQSGSNWDVVVQGSNDVLVNTWQHWAMSRNNGTVRYFIDGTLVGSRVNSTSFTNTNGIISLLGRQIGSQHWGGGYMQDFNYTLGLARYTANFTPPTAEFEG